MLNTNDVDAAPVQPIVLRRFDAKVTIDKNELDFADRVIPEHRFVEYEPSDLEWMIPLGLAPRREIPPEVIDRASRRMRDMIEFEVLMGILPGERWPRT